MHVESVQDPRAATLVDLFEALWRELDTLYGPNPGPPFHPTAMTETEFFVAFDGGRGVGCICLVDTDDADVHEVKRMYVRPEARGTRAAAALLGAVEARAAERGAQRLQLETGVRQPRAIRFYEREGFERCDCWGTYAEDPESRCFVKRLASPYRSTTQS